MKSKGTQMHLYDVKIAHPRGGERKRVIASDKSAEQVTEKLEALGLSVTAISIRITEAIEVLTAEEDLPPLDTPSTGQTPKQAEPDTEPTPPVAPTGRLYGRSAQGPRRNATEMAEDRKIEELAAKHGVDISASAGVRVAAELLAELEAKDAGN
jgi:hypothetical protein